MQEPKSVLVGELIAVFPGLLWHGLGHRYAGDTKKAEEMELLEAYSLVGLGVGTGLVLAGQSDDDMFHLPGQVLHPDPEGLSRVGYARETKRKVVEPRPVDEERRRDRGRPQSPHQAAPRAHDRGRQQGHGSEPDGDGPVELDVPERAEDQEHRLSLQVVHVGPCRYYPWGLHARFGGGGAGPGGWA